MPAKPIGLVVRVTAAAATALAVVGTCLVGAYLARGPIGVRLATDYLRRRGVEARITIERLDSRGAVGTLSLGPRTRPDLTAERVEVEFGPIPLLRRGLVAPRLRSIRLIAPRLRATLHEGRLSFGSLQGLVDDAARHPGADPGPDVRVQAGRLLLATDAGKVAVDGEGDLRDGRIDRFELRLAPTDLAGRSWRTLGLNGHVALRAAGSSRVLARFNAAVRSLEGAAGGGRGLALDGTADLTHARSSLTVLDGPARVRATLTTAGLQGAGARIDSAAATLLFNGEARGPVTRPALGGRAQLDLRAATGVKGGLRIGGASARLAVLDGSLRPQGWGWTAAGRIRGSAAAETTTLDLEGKSRLRLARTRLALAGRAGWTGRASAALDGALSTTARLSGDDAGRLAAAVPVGMPSLKRAVALAFDATAVEAPAFSLALSGRNVTLELGRPLRLSGGRATLTLSGRPAAPTLAVAGPAASGGFDLHLSGDGLPQVGLAVPHWRVGRDGGGTTLGGRFGLRLAGDVPPLTGIQVALEAVATRRAGVLTMEALGCAPVSAARLGAAARPAAAALALRLCPAKAPLLVAERGTWRARADVRGLALEAPTATVAVGAADLRLDLKGGAEPPAGVVVVDRLTLTDRDPLHRFRPLGASGRVDLAAGALSGTLEVGRAGSPGALATVRFTHDLARAAGSARIEAAQLRFKPGVLQPGDLLPALGRSFTRVQGSVSATAKADWGARGLTTSARVTLEGVDVRTVLGAFTGVRGDLALTSLAPPASAPDQRLTATRLDALLPLTDVSGAFTLRPDAMDIAGASATLAKGRAALGPMTVPFDPAATLKGVVTLKGIDFGEVDGVLNLSDAVVIQSRMDGVIPFALGPEGLRIAGGRLAAVGPGRLSIRREALTGAPKFAGAGPSKTNAVQDFAYQALENLAFDALSADVDSKPKGRLGVLFHIRGRHDPPKAAPTRVGLIDLLRGRAFDEPIPLPKGTAVELTLDASLNLDDLLSAYRTLDRRGGSAEVQP